MATLTRITRAQARKMYESGKDIYLNPSKMRLNGVWSMTMKTNKAQTESAIYSAQDFDSLVNSFSYYNCTKETGNVVHFYRD